MQKFKTIAQRASDRHGGDTALKKLMPKTRSVRALSASGDDRYLSEMTRCVFQAGFVWRVVNHKWDDFEDVFFGFPPEKIIMLSPEQIERFGQNRRIIRNMQKIVAIQDNARYILDVQKEHGSFGKFVAKWPCENLIELFAHMKKHGSRLGGMSFQRVLRNMGKESFVLTCDVISCFDFAGF